MEFKPLSIQGAWVAESPVWDDNRGSFREWFRHGEIYSSTGVDFSVKQANFSMSNQGVIRGIHYSLVPGGQAKWVTCVSGSIVDVVVDLREGSPTFKNVEYIEMTRGDGKSVFVSPGLGHGFLARENDSGVTYLMDSNFAPEYEYAVSPTDPELNIEWGEFSSIPSKPVLSSKDQFAPTIETLLSQGKLPKYLK